MKKYFHSNRIEKYGPFSFDELKEEKIEKQTLIWYEGLEDWTPAERIKDLEDILKLIPPPLPNETPSQETKKSEDKTFNEDTVTNNDNRDSSVVNKQRMFSSPFSFYGRIRRLEYGLSLIILYAYAFLDGFLVTYFNGDENLIYVLLIPGYVFLFAQGAKRCHELGNSGWFQIIPFYIFWMIFAKGKQGVRNKYGINPKFKQF